MFSSDEPILSRRDMLRLSAAGVTVGSMAGGFLAPIATVAADPKVKRAAKAKSCILLYMGGGASHIDTFDPKPGNGEFQSIATSVPGVHFSEHLPKLAMHMKDLALIRSMSTTEGSHDRATYLLHTGYRAGVAGVTHPTLGSIVSASIGPQAPEVPNFVRIETGRGGLTSAGYLDPEHAPLNILDPAGGIPNLKPSDGLPAFDRRMQLLSDLNADFLTRKKAVNAQAHRDVYKAAARLMHSPKVKAFDLSLEPKQNRARYGTGEFADACLLARRLVEVGLPFIEIDFGDWDTHRENFPRVKALSQELDIGTSALLSDLKSRGLLDTTLVVWMGDFGRSPVVRDDGRNHHPKAWTTWLAGGGLKTGQVIGRTDKSGGTVEDRPVSSTDFLATIYTALGIDPAHEFETRTGRPMRLVPKGEKIITQLFSSSV